LEVRLIVLIDVTEGGLSLPIHNGEEQTVLTRIGKATRIGVGRRFAAWEVVGVWRTDNSRSCDRPEVAIVAALVTGAIVGVGHAAPGKIGQRREFSVERAISERVGAVE